jgi:hypothetical protein
MRIEPLRPNDTIVKLAMASMGFLLVLYLAVSVLTWQIVRTYENLDIQGVASAAKMLSYTASFRFMVFIVVIVFFLMWFSRAYHNLKRLGKSMNHEVGWTIGGWFVPILWWFRPIALYGEMADTYPVIAKAFPQHLQPDTPDQNNLKGIGNIWWGTCVAFTILNTFINGSMQYAKEPALYMVLPSLIMLIPGVCVMLVMHRMSKVEAVVYRIWVSGDFQQRVEDREMAKAAEGQQAGGNEKPAMWYKTEAENEKQLGRNEDPFQ